MHVCTDYNYLIVTVQHTRVVLVYFPNARCYKVILVKLVYDYTQLCINCYSGIVIISRTLHNALIITFL